LGEPADDADRMDTEAAERVVAPGFPVRPVRLIEPFGRGSGPELVGHAIAAECEARWGQPVSIENHPGEGSTVAPLLVARASPDGHTLLINTSAHAYSAAANRDLPYDPLGDFIPVAALTRQAYVLVASPTHISSLQELIELARTKTAELTFGSTGVGTGTHIGIEKLNHLAGIAARHLPASRGDAISDVVAKTARGETDYAMSPVSIAEPLLRDHQLVALGVTTAQRCPLLPDVPTLSEAGVAGYDFPIWYGLWAPTGTPSSTIVRIATDVSAVLVTSAVRDTLARHGADPIDMTQSDFARFVRDEVETAARIIEQPA
jgi:tripartite-type tricarboxylate transporter receptor subunit TctC